MATLQSLNWLDWTLLSLVFLSVLAGFLRGILRSLFSLAGVIVGLFLAAHYCFPLSTIFVAYVNPAAFAPVLAFVAILVATIVLATLLGYLLRSACRAIGLGFADRLGGAAFGLLRGYLAVAAFLIPVAPYLATFPAAKTSFVLPYFLKGAHGISFVLPQRIRDGLLRSPVRSQ